MSAASFVYRKPLAGRVVQKKPNGDYEDKNSFCFRMSVWSANCAKKQKEVITWMTWIVYRIRAGIDRICTHAPKYRRKVIYGKLRKDIGKILRTLCDYKYVEIIEAHAMPDHIHMLVSIPPKLAVADFMGYLKGKSTLMIFERRANLK